MNGVSRQQFWVRFAAGVATGLALTALPGFYWGFGHVSGFALLTAAQKPAEPVIVAIDADSLQKYGRWPWSRERLAALISKITANHPKSLGIDILFSGTTRQDPFLVGAVHQYTRICLPETLHLTFRRSLFSQAVRSGATETPVAVLKDASGSVGFIDLPSPMGDEVRTMLLRFGRHEAFALKVIRLAYPEFRQNSDRLLLRFIAHPRDFPTVSAADVMQTDSMPSLRGKIVLVGLTASGISDWHQSANPLVGKIPGIYLHAYAIANLLEWGICRELPFHWLLLTMVLICMVMAFLPLRSLWTATPGILILNWAVAFFLFQHGIWASPYLIGLPIAGMVLTAWFQEKEIVRRVLSKYIAPQIMRQVLADPKTARVGTEQELTVLFADLRGFTGLAEALPPPDLTRMLNKHLEMMAHSIESYGGIIDKYTGDGVMAFFYSGGLGHSHAISAFQAALKIHATVRQNGEVSVGIGIASGKAVVGEIGSDSRKDYTVIGDTVNIAARLEQMAQPGWICLNGESARAIDPAIPLQSIAIEGRSRPIRAVCLTDSDVIRYQALFSGKELPK